MINYDNNVDLIKKAQSGDEEAKNLLIQYNYPLVKSIIKRYVNKGVEYDDLFQLGCVGFVKAINNFNTDYDVKFSTYAVPMIAGEIKRFLRDDGYIKVSRAMKLLSLQIKKYIDTELGVSTEPDINEIAKHFNITPQEVVFAIDASRYPVSLSSPLDNENDEGGTLSDRIVDEEQSNQELDHFVLKELINNLDKKDRKIIIMRYYRDKTQSEVAKEMGVSQVQISRIENKILAKLKKSFDITK